MTIKTEEGVQFYPSAGYEIATGLYQGIWRGLARVTGDGSGALNFMQARLVFNQAGAPFNPRYYSLEQIGLENGVSTAASYEINTQNMLGVFSTDSTVGLRFVVDLEDPITIDVAPNIRDLRFPLRMWLGRQADRNTQTFLQAQTLNVLDVVTTFWAMGYYWEAGAQHALGGYKYPTNPGMLG